MKEISTNKAPMAVGPYSQAIISNNIMYISGQIPINPETNELITDYKKACIQIFENIKNILKVEDMDLSNAVKVSIFIKDLSHFNEVNEVYGKYFIKPYPARSCVEVTNLPKGAILEIELIASKGE